MKGGVIYFQIQLIFVYYYILFYIFLVIAPNYPRLPIDFSSPLNFQKTFLFISLMKLNVINTVIDDSEWLIWTFLIPIVIIINNLYLDFIIFIINIYRYENKYQNTIIIIYKIMSVTNLRHILFSSLHGKKSKVK